MSGFIAPAIMAGGSVLSGISGLMGANNARDAAQAQNDLGFRNYYLQRQIANDQRDMAQAGSTDARGNKTQYIQGVGWVTTPTAQTRQLIGASDAEELARNTTDASRSRIRRGNTFNRQLTEGQDANAVRAGMPQGQESLDDIRAKLTERNVAHAISGKEDLQRRIGLNALRTGTGGEAALAKMGRNGMMDTRTAIADARADTSPTFVGNRASRMNSGLNEYSMLASRATAPDDVPFSPTALPENLATGQARQQAAGVSGLSSAMKISSPQVQYAASNTPLAIGGLTSAMKGLANDPKTQALWNTLFNKNGGDKSYDPVDLNRSGGNSDWRGSTDPNTFY